LYKKYLRGGSSSHGLDRNEFLLKKAQWSSDPARLVATMANSGFFKKKSVFAPQGGGGFWVCQVFC